MKITVLADNSAGKTNTMNAKSENEFKRWYCIDNVYV